MQMVKCELFRHREMTLYPPPPIQMCPAIHDRVSDGWIIPFLSPLFLR